jgi:hypothetical protein
MGIIARAYDFVNGVIADAEEIDTELNTIYNEINGNLDVTNMKAAAGFTGSMLASAPNGVFEAKINNDAVINRCIKDGEIANSKMKPGDLLYGSLKFVVTSRSLGTLSLAPDTHYFLDPEAAGVGWSTVLSNNTYIPINAWLSKAWPIQTQDDRVTLNFWKNTSPTVPPVGGYSIALCNTSGSTTIDFSGMTINLLVLRTT